MTAQAPELLRPFVLVHMPIRTRNPLNLRHPNSRFAAMAQRRDEEHQRDFARALTIAAMRAAGILARELLPACVTLTRCSSGRLDPHDGLPAALKRVVDGIALALWVDDGGPLVRWVYAQRKVSVGNYSVEVRIERQAS